MAVLTHDIKQAFSIALPLALLAFGLGTITTLTFPASLWPHANGLPAPQTVTLPPGEVTYRAHGNFFRNGAAVDAPLVTAAIAEPLAIMKYQVTAADYGTCVLDGACAPAEPENLGQGNVPATGVNFADAQAYAQWLSRKTGQTWVLPTDEQWAYAAGSRFTDDALGIEDDAANPALRWLADYRKESARKRQAEPTPLPIGSYGENEHGLADMAGNVWEWTQTCHRRVHVDAKGTVLSEQAACGVQVLEGKHRAQMSYFIRDAKSGGCSVGVPPDNLGFRLVRLPQWHEGLLNRIGL